MFKIRDGVVGAYLIGLAALLAASLAIGCGGGNDISGPSDVPVADPVAGRVVVEPGEAPANPSYEGRINRATLADAWAVNNTDRVQVITFASYKVGQVTQTLTDYQSQQVAPGQRVEFHGLRFPERRCGGEKVQFDLAAEPVNQTGLYPHAIDYVVTYTGPCGPTPEPTPTPCPNCDRTPQPTPTPTPQPSPSPEPTCEYAVVNRNVAQGFTLPNSGEATETEWVNANVQPGPYHFSFKHDGDGGVCMLAEYAAPVVLVKAATKYVYYTNVVVGQTLCSFELRHAISHVSYFTCVAQ